MILKVFTTQQQQVEQPESKTEGLQWARHSVGQKQFIIRFIHGDIIESRPNEPFRRTKLSSLYVEPYSIPQINVFFSQKCAKTIGNFSTKCQSWRFLIHLKNSN